MSEGLEDPCFATKGGGGGGWVGGEHSPATKNSSCCSVMGAWDGENSSSPFTVNDVVQWISNKWNGRVREAVEDLLRKNSLSKNPGGFECGIGSLFEK